jgi:hypothetical protein
MAITEGFSGSEAVTATEWSAPRDASYAIGSPQTDDGIYQVFLDLSDMVLGDELRIRIYEKVTSASTQRIVFEAYLSGPQSEPTWVSPSLILMHGWDVTLQAVVGTITITWSIRKIA